MTVSIPVRIAAVAGLLALPGGEFSRYILRSGAICPVDTVIPVPVRWLAQSLIRRPSVRSSPTLRRWVIRWSLFLAASR